MAGKYKRKNIVVVEDDEMFSLFLNRYLENHLGDVNITVCESGKAGLRTIESTRPDAVILDYYLDDMTGLDILKEVKKIAPETIVIVLSAQKKVDTAVMLLNEGAHDYISKSPDSAHELIKSLENAFQNRDQKKGTMKISLYLSKKGFLRTLLFVVFGFILLLIILNLISNLGS